MKRVVKNNIPNANDTRNLDKRKILVAYIIGVIILIYFVYCIIQLIKQPTDVIAVENGKLLEEENAVRICDT